ncbi:hypothetical protein GCM10010448_29600 [Streptomyces glomeratus]|uniref:Uncharacterized protein n=1 Tax=Streptomyces glomeratus TaxID=284452 RepID=A0ABP6LLB5_9ACTN
MTPRAFAAAKWLLAEHGRDDAHGHDKHRDDMYRDDMHKELHRHAQRGCAHVAEAL